MNINATTTPLPFTVKELSPFVKRLPKTIYKDLIRRPESLPPAIYYGNSANPLFICVSEFLSGQAISKDLYERAERQRKAKQAIRAQKRAKLNRPQSKKVGRPSHASKMGGVA